MGTGFCLVQEFSRDFDASVASVSSVRSLDTLAGVGKIKHEGASKMKNIRLGLVHALAVAMILLGASGMAFGQQNVPGFRGVDRKHKAAAPPPAPSDPPSPNTDCTLILPANPLSAEGLATPFELTATDPANGPCNEANSAQSAFAQAAVFDPATGQISIYNPLVIDKDTTPAAPPVVPKLPANAIVALWFGYNADNLTLASASATGLANARCVNGLPGSIFSQVSYCNAPAFFRAANAAIASSTLKVPPLGTANDGLACPTVRNFFVVDQDQSDNLPTLYLITADGKLAQHTQQNLALFPTATTLGNASDNHLTDAFLDPALGCQPWTAPDLADPGQQVAAQPLNELHARVHQPTPVALVPDGDPMAQVSGTDNLMKTNLYRLGVDQPMAFSVFDVDTSRYCRQMLRIAPSRMFGAAQGHLNAFPSPVPSAGTTLLNFLAERFVASYQILNCDTLIQQANPIIVTNDPTTGAATGATLSVNYSEELQNISGQKAADDAADSAARSQGPVE
jgi:hypothetical protein